MYRRSNEVLKFAHVQGALAQPLLQQASYKPQDVIAEVDKSFAGNVDDASWTYRGRADNATPIPGPDARQLTNYRQRRSW